jgi:type IV pilus assembly protein PilC
MAVTEVKTTRQHDSAQHAGHTEPPGLQKPRQETFGAFAKTGRGEGPGILGRSQQGLAAGRGQQDQVGLWPQTAAANRKLRMAKVKQTDLIMFTTQLSVMLDSGVVLSDALDGIAEQLEHSVFKMILADVADKVKSGENFSRALAEYPRVFNAMFVSMVRASEASGRMADMLGVLSDYLNFEAETRKKVKGALTYPIMMAIMALIATSTLMFFVLPRFVKIYEARGSSLPKITQLLVSVSSATSDLEVMTIVVTVSILATAGLYYWTKTLSGQRVMDFLKIRIPLIGTMFIDLVVTRSMRIMATMVGTGVNLLDAIEVVRGSCQNYYFQQLWAGADKRVRDGYQLSESIMLSAAGERGPQDEKYFNTKTRLIAPSLVQMLKAGEKSGNLGEVCDKISTFYGKKLESSIKNVTALIEPLMIMILGAIIGTIAIALLLPVFKISSVIAH